MLFEFLGAFIETPGYISLVISLIFGVVNWPFALLFMLVAVLSGVLLSLPPCCSNTSPSAATGTCAS